MAHEEVPSQMVQQILNCQYQEWYPQFKSLAFRSDILPLPKPFVSYLLDDGGVFLPESSDALPKRFREGNFSAVDNDEYRRWGEEADVQEEDDEEHMQAEVPSFPELEQAIDTAIARLGGTVVPKLNWSSPKDTAWVSPTGSVKCNNAAEVLLLLKSSDVIVHDLCHAFDNCSDGGITRPEHFVLVLRKWYPLRPEMEFRCFVRDNQLRGICQREVTSFYSSILESRDELRLVIEAFIQDQIVGRFPDPDFVCDVYVTSDRRVKIMDFNAYGGNTLPLLFSWSDFRGTEIAAGGSEAGKANPAETPSVAPPRESGEVREPGAGLKCLTPRRSKQSTRIGERSSGLSEGRDKGEELMDSSRGSRDVEKVEEGARADLPSGPGELCPESSGRSDQPRGPVEFRIIETAMGVMPSMTIAGGAPFDLVDLSKGGAIDEFIKRCSETPDPE